MIVARDILLAKETGAKLHLCHCSTADSVTMIQKAKEYLVCTNRKTSDIAFEIGYKLSLIHISRCTNDRTGDQSGTS